jgi:hypothetical protein
MEIWIGKLVLKEEVLLPIICGAYILAPGLVP